MLCGCFWRYLCRKVCSPIAYFAFFSEKWPLTLRLLYSLICFHLLSDFARFSSCTVHFFYVFLVLVAFSLRFPWLFCGLHSLFTEFHDFRVILWCSCVGAQRGQWSHLPAGRLNIACRLLSCKLSEMPKITLDKSWIMVYYNNAVIRNA